MTVLILEPDVQDDLQHALSLLPEISVDAKDDAELKGALHTMPAALLAQINPIFETAMQVLKDNAYVQLRGFPLGTDARSILLIGHALGTVFSDLSHQSALVNEAIPSPNAQLQGNQTEPLFLHTDFAMLDQPPACTIVQCVHPDPLGAPFGENGVAVARHIISKFYGTAKLDLVLNTLLPFAGKKPDGSIVLTMRPIMEIQPDGTPRVCFHPSRIHYGFRLRNEKPLPQETEALAVFQDMAQQVRLGVQQTSGDILIVNNRAALHDRTLCSLSLSKRGLRARISRILFLQDFKEITGW